MKYEEGRYRCKVTGQGIGETKNAKLPQLFVSFYPMLQFLPGGETENIESPDKRSLSRLLTTRDGEVTDKMASCLKADLESIGFEGDLEDFVPGSDGFFDCTGNEFTARCSYETRDGTQYENWQIEWPKRGGSPLESTKIAELNAMYSGKLAPKKEKATEERF